jgi:peptide/nickel transport system permease protein
MSVISGLRQRAIPASRRCAPGWRLSDCGCWSPCLAPWIAPFDPIAQDASSSLLPPGGAHLFGTDNFGRDIFSRVLWGRGWICKSACWGYVPVYARHHARGAVRLSRRRGGCAMMRVIDIVLAFPFLVLMLAIIAILGPGLGSFYIAMAMVGWVSTPGWCAQVLTLKQRDFILAARSLGYGHRGFFPPSAAQRYHRSAGFFDVRLRAGAAERRLGELPGWRAAAYRRVGRDGGGRAEFYHHRVVDNHLSGAGHRAAGDGL